MSMIYQCLAERSYQMKRKTLLALSGITFLILLLTVSFLMTAFAQPTVKPVVLKVNHMWPAGSAQEKHIARWAEKIKAATNGAITCRMFPVGTLSSPMEIYPGTVKGVCDIGMGMRYEPVGREFSEYLVTFLGEVKDTQTAAKIQDDIWDKFKEWREEWKDCKVLWMGVCTPTQIHTTRKPVRTLSDMKGLQIRTPPGTGTGDLVKILGATPVAVSISETYTSLEKGIVDGVVTANEALKSSRFADVTKYTTFANLWAAPGVYVVMNQKTYENLPPNFQKAIDDSLKWGKSDWQQMWIDEDDVAEEFAKSKGHQFITLDPAEGNRLEAIKRQANDGFAVKVDGKGLPGTKLLKFIRERIAYYGK
jgi:TRAP-type C4-dicarboxylate transport system substrate-binding protein